MSHIDLGPLPAYNSLADSHLTGYFSNSRMRRHLRKSGLITKKGEIVSENTYRLNMARKEHKKHVKNMLAQAIVHKTLDLERSRQSEIRKKLEEIAKIELVRRVKTERHRHLEEAIFPCLAPKSSKARTKSPKKSASSRPPTGQVKGHERTTEVKESNGQISAVQERASREKKRENYVLPLVSPRGGSRPSSSSTYSDMKSKGRYRPMRPKSTPSRKGRRPISALSSNYDDENETVVYLDDEGRPISPSHIDENDLKYASKDPIDTRHLYSLDTTALRKYAMLMAKVEQGKDGMASPYLIPQVPIPPKSPHHGGTPRSAHRFRSSDAARLQSPKRPTTADQAYLHPSGSAKHFRGQQESMCEIFMIYHGHSLSLAREQFDKRQDIVVEQQHCGGNTLTVFRDKMEPDTEFSFISYRHCGYPFALTIYVDGKMDCRISTCCEYRHSKGRRIAGKNGHFSVKTITGARPCYKCQVEKGIQVKSSAPRPKLKRPPQHQEEVVVVETKEEQPEQKEIEADGHVGHYEEEILVPVDHLEDDKKSGVDESEAAGEDNYDDDDFEDSGPEEGFLNFQPKEARGVDKTTGKADINYVSDDDDYEDDDDWEERYSKNPALNDDDGRKTSLGQSKEIEEDVIEEIGQRPSSPVPAKTEEEEEKGRSRRDSASSSSSSSSSASSASSKGRGSSDDYSDSKVEEKSPEKAEEKLVSMEMEEQKNSDNEDKVWEIPIGSTEGGAPEDEVETADTKPIETVVEKEDDVTEDVRKSDEPDAEINISRASSSSVTSSSSSGSAAIHDQGPNVINDPTLVVEEKLEEKEDNTEKEEDIKREEEPEDYQEEVEERKDLNEELEQQKEDDEVKREEEEEEQYKEEEKENLLTPVVPPISVSESDEPPKELYEETKGDQKADSGSSSSSPSSSDDEGSSDSDSDKESQEPEKKETNVSKETKIETTADVHVEEDGTRRSVGTYEEIESDPEATHGGNDPDNVANDNVMTVSKTIDPVPLAHPKEGSVVPLLEANKNAVEVNAVSLNKTQVYEVAEFIEKTDNLNSVTLVNCEIDDDDVQKLMEALRDSPSNPVMVNLSLNPLTASSVDHILKTTKVKTSIEAILLQGTRLGDDGVNALIDGIMLQYNMIKDDPKEKDKGVHELDLSDCKFGDEGAVAISRLMQSDMDIDTLTLSHNHAVSLEGWTVIGNALKETNNLETLTLDHNFIGDEGMEAIGEGLEKCTSLTALDINDVGMTDKGARILMDVLKKNTTILELVMAENKVSDPLAENIQQYITLNKAAHSQET